MSDPVSTPPSTPLLRTPLHALHLELGAKMVPFAGYEMPVSYPAGISPSTGTVAMRRSCSTCRTWVSSS